MISRLKNKYTFTGKKTRKKPKVLIMVISSRWDY